MLFSDLPTASFSNLIKAEKNNGNTAQMSALASLQFYLTAPYILVVSEQEVPILLQFLILMARTAGIILTLEVWARLRFLMRGVPIFRPKSIQIAVSRA